MLKFHHVVHFPTQSELVPEATTPSIAPISLHHDIGLTIVPTLAVITIKRSDQPRLGESISLQRKERQ
jgi:hypothetical protein